MTTTMRLRRSELSTPGSNVRMIERAAASNADLVFLDLEDSVAPSEKVAARARVIDAFPSRGRCAIGAPSAWIFLVRLHACRA